MNKGTRKAPLQVGQVRNGWTILTIEPNSYFKCRGTCGHETLRSEISLRSNQERNQKCGTCAYQRQVKHVGKQYGNRVVVEDTGKRTASNKHIYALQCVHCGDVIERLDTSFTRKTFRPCPCEKLTRAAASPLVLTDEQARHAMNRAKAAAKKILKGSCGVGAKAAERVAERIDEVVASTMLWLTSQGAIFNDVDDIGAVSWTYAEQAARQYFTKKPVEVQPKTKKNGELEQDVFQDLDVDKRLPENFEGDELRMFALQSLSEADQEFLLSYASLKGKKSAANTARYEELSERVRSVYQEMLAQCGQDSNQKEGHRAA